MKDLNPQLLEDNKAIDDRFFLAHPEKVAGVESIRSGPYGPEKEIKGTKEDVLAMFSFLDKEKRTENVQKQTLEETRELLIELAGKNTFDEFKSKVAKGFYNIDIDNVREIFGVGKGEVISNDFAKSFWKSWKEVYKVQKFVEKEESQKLKTKYNVDAIENMAFQAYNESEQKTKATATARALALALELELEMED